MPMPKEKKVPASRSGSHSAAHTKHTKAYHRFLQKLNLRLPASKHAFKRMPIAVGVHMLSLCGLLYMPAELVACPRCVMANDRLLSAQQR